jgi:hypothetical protein
MVRIDRPSGFAPAGAAVKRSAAKPASRPVAISRPASILSQATPVPKEAQEIYRYLSEAEGQLASVERNFSGLAAAIGQTMALEAVAQARASVQLYLGAYNVAMDVQS